MQWKKSQKNQKKPLKILLVSHGSLYSTFDIYINWLHALRNNCDVEWCKGFDFHNLIIYHDLGSQALLEATGVDFGTSDLAIVAKASRELLVDIIVEDPDIVFFVNGERLPIGIFSEILKYRHETGRKFLLAGYITEAPYINDSLDLITNWYDVLFTNDLYDKERRDPEGEKFVFYLPHAYNPSVHYPSKRGEGYERDVFFCGSLFPERVELFRQIDWSKLDNPLIVGPSNVVESKELYGEELDQWELDGLYRNNIALNADLAGYYRSSKIVLNKHRTYGWTPGGDVYVVEDDAAYSTGPRLLEVAGCGGFTLTDYRPEVVDIFGDSVPIFEDAEQLNTMLAYYTEHDDERRNMASTARLRASQHTYDHRVKLAVDVFNEALEVYRKTGGNRQ